MNPRRMNRFNDMPEMVSRVLELNSNEVNTKNVFLATGIWSIDANIFGETNFMSSSTIDRQIPNIPADEMNVDDEEWNEEEMNWK